MRRTEPYRASDHAEKAERMRTERKKERGKEEKKETETFSSQNRRQDTHGTVSQPRPGPILFWEMHDEPGPARNDWMGAGSRRSLRSSLLRIDY